jgi:hypothetical protein
MHGITGTKQPTEITEIRNYTGEYGVSRALIGLEFCTMLM